MDVRYHLTGLGVLLVLFETVTLDVSVTELKGGTAILPCTYPNVTLSEEDMTFMWRFKDQKNVYDFINGKDRKEKQEDQFKDRASLLAPQKGDFSLRLTDLTENDSGTYTCYVPKAIDLQIQHVVLTIRENPTPEAQSPELRKDPENSSIQIGPQKLLLLILLILGLST